MNDAIWGGIIIVYVLSGIPIMSIQASELGDADRPGLSRGTKWGLAWGAGLAIILAIWKLTTA